MIYQLIWMMIVAWHRFHIVILWTWHVKLASPYNQYVVFRNKEHTLTGSSVGLSAGVGI